MTKFNSEYPTIAAIGILKHLREKRGYDNVSYIECSELAQAAFDEIVRVMGQESEIAMMLKGIAA